jgi:hypothetical protein
MVIDDPLLDPKSDLKINLYYMDFAFTVIFWLESILKIISFGLIMNG